MIRVRSLLAVLACFAFTSTHAETREYIIYDGQSYPDAQLDVAAASPVMVKPAQLARNAGIRAGRVTSFDTAAGRERGGITAANTVVIGPFAVQDAAVAVLERLATPLLGMDVLNRFQVAYAGGFMVLRSAR